MDYLFSRRLSFEHFLATRRFTAFDGVRALAAVMVIAYHFAEPVAIVSSGWLGVHLFFVLSGFLITTLLVREEAERGRVSLVDFWIRRIFRILPAYYLVLLLTVSVIALQNQVTEMRVAESIGWFLTVNPDLAPSPMGFQPAWTIGVEQRFYLVWPALAFVAIVGARRRRAIVWAAAVIVLFVLTLTVSTSFVHYVVILLGCGLALALHSSTLFRAVSVLTARGPALVALLLLAVVFVAAPVLQSVSGSDVLPILLFGAATTLALPGLIVAGPVARSLSWRPLTWLGDRSYSLYLLQIIAFGIVAEWLPPRGANWTFVVTLAIAIVLADALHRWVEVPGIEWGRRLTHVRRERRRVPSVDPDRLEHPEAGS